MDKQFEGLDLKGFYTETTELLMKGSANKGIFAPFYRVICKLSDLLINKADFGQRAKKAYAVVVSGETAKYGNVILKKGVTPVA